MPKFKVNTKTSLFEPVEIEIDGKIFKVKKITKEINQQIIELDKKAREGDSEAIFQRLELLIGPSKEFNNLGLDEVVSITKFISENILRPTPIEKNSSRPGQEKSLL